MKLRPLRGFLVQHGGGLLARIRWRKLAVALVSVVLFIFALELMKAGARGLIPLIRDVLKVSNPVNGMGFGWLFAYAVMSGSPVAAASLTFYDAGAIDQASAFAMITGSRLGAGLIVLIIGLIYMLRGHEKSSSIITGLLTLTVTATTYLPALPLGILLLKTDLLYRISARPAGEAVSLIDLIIEAPVRLAQQFLPEWLIFILGLGVIVVSFNLLDGALPQLNLESSAFKDISRVLYRPPIIFLLGFAITMMTMSVSISIGLLVPLSARGYIRRENIIPYIMGCNISTFIDTLVASFLLGNPGASVIVLTEMLSVAVVSSIILLLFMDTYERLILRFVMWVDARRRRLAWFFLAIFLVPLVLLLVR